MLPVQNLTVAIVDMAPANTVPAELSKKKMTWELCIRKSVKLYCERTPIRIRVKILWDNVDCRGSWDAYLASPVDFFAGADDIITNLAKEREPEIEIIEHTP